MPTGAIEQLMAVAHKMIGLACQVREVQHFECEVVHHFPICIGESYAVMVWIAAHPEESIIQPVRNTEPQHFTIELGAPLAAIHE